MPIFEGPCARGGPPGLDVIASGPDALPPPGLALLSAHVFSRHGERTPVVSQALPTLAKQGEWRMCGFRDFHATVMQLVNGERTSSTLPHLRLARQSVIDGKEQVADPRTCRDGELTDLGRVSTLRLGRALRELYVDRLQLLPPSLPADSLAIQLRSTDVPRTILSLQQLVLGLLTPPGGSPSGPYHPVIEIRSASDESLQFNVGKCAHLAAMHGAFVAAAARRYNDSLLAPLDKRLAPFVREPVRIDSKIRAVFVADSASVADAHDVEVPKVFHEPDVQGAMETAVVHEWFDGYADDEFKRLAAGRMSYDLLEKLEERVANPQHPLKLALNSCHDTTIGAWLHVFMGKLQHWPPFTSHIIIELFSRPSRVTPSFFRSWFGSIRDDHFVRVRYQGEALRLPACQAPANQLEGSHGKVCTFAAFRNALQQVAMSKEAWRAGCGKAVESDVADARVAAIVKQAMAG